MYEVGCRVVRGPDWKWGSQDSSEGHVGTVVEVGRSGSTSSPDRTVVVQWDMGSRTNYRVGYQQAYDLRLFDNAPAGVRHPNVICDGCKDHGISGMLWKCGQCFDFDLCTMCYMNDTHDLSHPFLRIDTPSSEGVEIDARESSPKIVSKGIFAGARVMRGPDWDWGNQDGGIGKVGRVVDIRGWDNESGRSVSNVIWGSGSTNVYRLGHKGKVDLKCVQASSAGSYYVNHLPVLGLPSSSISCRSLPKSTHSRSTTQQQSFNVGDKVEICTDIQRLKEMQAGHGGWNPRMADFIGKVGVLHRVTDKGDIRVEYESGIRWTFNPSAVSKITCFSIGDTVVVLNDPTKVKELQEGHGEWIEVMREIIGKCGTIQKIYGDGDLRINFPSSVWTMNPLAVTLVQNNDRDRESNNSMYANANRRDENMSQDPMSAMLPHLLGEMALDNSYTVERFVRESAQGRVENIKKMLPKMREKINHKNSGKTPLQVAAHQGHAEIVMLLIGNGANLEIADDEGDTALHFATFGNQAHIIEILLKAGGLVNALNRAQCTPLHVAVNKQFLDCVKVLLKYKCNVNIQDNFGDTALHDGIGKESREIIDCFINTPGLDFTLKNNRGFNVLHHAALKGNSYAVEKLVLKARQLVDVKKDDGFGGVHLAALNGHYAVLVALLQEGQGEIELRNNRKQTPLHLAVSQGYLPIVEYLVRRGGDVGAMDEDGDSPLHVVLAKHFEGGSGGVGKELRKTENAPQIATIWTNLLSCGWSVSDEELGPSALACFLAQSGGDLNLKNRRGITPLDLVKTERLREMLVLYSAQPQSHHESDEVCPPPGPSICPSPLFPKEEKNPPPLAGVECLLCCESSVELVLFEPCGHRSVCEDCCSRLKKCAECREGIERKVGRGGKIVNSSGSGKNVNAERLKYLEKKFAEIEDAFCCSICMERKRNVFFLCGHGACEKCALALTSCHMCRTPIKQKVNIY